MIIILLYEESFLNMFCWMIRFGRGDFG